MAFGEPSVLVGVQAIGRKLPVRACGELAELTQALHERRLALLPFDHWQPAGVRPERADDVERDAAEPAHEVEREPILQGEQGLLDQARQPAGESAAPTGDEYARQALPVHVPA